MSEQKEYLWDILNLDKNFKCADVDIAYSKIENKTDEVKLAWKILRDEYYSEIYKKYLSIDIVIKAGFILDNIDGCLLFHCQAGKDRTGVLAMILMGLAGVSKEDIVANYEVTHTYLKENVKLRLEDGLEELEFSKPQWIEKAYDHIIEHYGSFKVYLMAVGLTKKEIKKIRRKLAG